MDKDNTPNKTWETPVVEKISLKEALTGDGPINEDDAFTSYS